MKPRVIDWLKVTWDSGEEGISLSPRAAKEEVVLVGSFKAHRVWFHKNAPSTDSQA